MKLIRFDLAGQNRTWEKYDSEEEYLKVEKEIEKFWGEPVVSPCIRVSNILPRRYEITK